MKPKRPRLAPSGWAYLLELHNTDRMQTVKQTSFRFTPEDLAYLDAVQRHTGVSTRIDALRAVIRLYARAERLEVAKPGAKGNAKR